MNPTLGTIDKLSIVITLVLLFGIISSFLDFGILSIFFSAVMPLIFIFSSALTIYGILKKRYFYLFGAIIYLLCFNFFFQFSINEKDIEAKDTISLLTYNAKAFKQPITTNYQQNAVTEITKFIDSLKADILIFQEFSFEASETIKGYPYYFLGNRQHIDKSLLAIYTKYPIINEGYVDFPSTMNNAIYADIKIQQDTIRVYNSHLQSFLINEHILTNRYNDYAFWKSLNNRTAKQIEQAKLIKSHSQTSTNKIIICGDFNATPYSQTYRILKRGMKDSFLSNGNSFGTTFSIFNYPFRLDYFLNDDQIKVLSHDNFTLNLSDHEPVYVEFKIK